MKTSLNKTLFLIFWLVVGQFNLVTFGLPAGQNPRDGGRQIPRDQRNPLPFIQSTDFQIPSAEDEARVEFRLTETGLYSAEISFRCENNPRRHDRLSVSLQSGTRPGLTQWRPGDLRYWFGQGHTLNPETSYRFYFWVDQAMLQELGAERTLRFVLIRLDRVRSREEGEFEARRRVNITLPQMSGRIHLRSPNPIAIEATATDRPPVHELNLDGGEIVQYRVAVRFPRVEGRMAPYQFKAEFRVPLSQGRRNADLGGFLLSNGNWRNADRVTQSATFDFLASPATEFSRDAYGRRRAAPLEEDWLRFKANGMWVQLGQHPTVRTSASFYLSGGERPPDFYVVELEDLTLSALPDEGEGAFWLKLRNAADLVWAENPGRANDDFAGRRPIYHDQMQNISTSIPIPRSGANQGRALVGLPLFALPMSALEGKETLAVVANPHYFHQMSTWEEAEYIWKNTEAGQVIEGFATQDLAKVGTGIVKWIVKASRAKNPDLYRSFGVGSFETDVNRHWAVRNAPERYQVQGSAANNVAYQEISGNDGRNVARVSALLPGGDRGRNYTSTIRVRKVPGVFVEGAKINVLSVKTNRNFNGHLKVRFGIIGHEGGREHTSGQGLNLESAAVGTPFSYWASKVAERGPFNLRSGRAQAIDFSTIDFSRPDRDPDSLWEQLHHTFGTWAGIHLQVALVNLEERAGQTDLNPRRVKLVNYADVGYLTIYPYDQLYDPRFGRLRSDVERDGEWVILRGTIAPHGEILDEVELEVRLKVRALDTGPLIWMTTRQ
ncbi:MAG TPA: hypothetical protein VFZ34_24970 [Blastocatellia bacterium]|nr:hypothetical protein [Blastocatellia bacterium]